MKKKKIVSILLAVLILMSCIPISTSSVFAQNNITIYSEDLSCESDSTITVPIKIKNNTGIKATAIILEYDKTCFEVNDVYAGELFEYGNFWSDFGGDNFSEGNFKTGWSDSEIISDDGILFYVEFNVAGSAFGAKDIIIGYDETSTVDGDFNFIDFDCEKFNVNIKNIEYENTTRFKLSDVQVYAGNEFDVDINVENLNGLNSIEFSMNYDKNNFEFLSYINDKNLNVSVTNNSGRLSIIIKGLSSLNDGKNIVTLKFKSNENTAKGSYSFRTTYKNAVGNKLINITGCNITMELSSEYDYSILYSDDIYGNYSEEIVVPIKIKHNVGIQAYKILFDYDESKLQLLNVTAGAFPKKPNQSEPKNGHFYCTWATTDNVYLNDVVLNIHFFVLTQEKDVLSKLIVSYEPDETCNENQEFVTLECNDVNITLNHTPIVTDIALNSKPSKLTYELFEEFDASGMVIEATKDDGSVETITDYTVTGFETNSVGTKTVTISYEGKSVSFDIEVAHTHTWGEWETVSSPKCLDKGSEKRVCSVCREIEMRDVDPLGHNWEKDFTIDNEPKCEIAGSKSIHCSRCDVVKDITPIAPIGHDYDSSITKDATCTENGIKTFVCKNDPSHAHTEEIPKLNHNYVASVTKQPTCEEKGIKTFACSNDPSHTYTEDIPAIGHSFELTKTIKATCTEDGKEIYTCKNNSSHTKEVVLQATGHTPSDWIIDKKPTYLEDGSKHKECTVCKTVLATETVSMLDDITAPKIEIKVKDNSFKSFINNISFGLFFKETVDITITAQDAESGVEKVEYIKTNIPISESDIVLQTEWISGEKLTVSDDEEFIIYVRATDKQGNISYVGTDGMVVDKTAPVINGITNNAIYCQPVSFTVSDKYIEKVIVNGTEALTDSGEYTLPSADSQYNIVAVDKAGNETVYNVTVNEGHTYGDWVTDKSADCTNNGEKHRVCSICGHRDDAEIPTLGHDYSSEFTVDIEPTCTTDGEKSKHCSRCDDRKDITVLSATGHSFDEWKTVVSPDCTNSGSRQRVCTACGFTETENFNPNGHKWDSDYTIDIPSTCTTDGSKSIHCANCDVVKDSQIIPATGHNLGEYKVIESATCTENGLEKRTCANCDYSETREIPALGHDYAEEFTVDKTPTCTENGEKSRQCSRCDSKADITIVPATGHSYGEWTVVTVPTCTEKGAQQRVCSICGDAELKEISASGHIWNDDYTVDKEPSCTTEGSKSIHCANCDAVKDSVVIPAVGHSGGKANCHNGAICDSCSKEYGEPDLSNHDGETEIRGYIAPTIDDFGYTGDTYCKSCGTKLADGERIDKLPSKPTETTKPSDTTENPTDTAESTTQKSETTNISDSVNKNTSKKSPATGSITALPIAVSTAFAISLICVVKRKKKEG